MKIKLLLVVSILFLNGCVEQDDKIKECENLEREYRELQYKFMFPNSNKDYEVLKLFIEVNKEKLINCGLIEETN